VSDYIGNLVVKNLNPRAVLQPRLASRFEPLTPLVSLASERPFVGMSSDEAAREPTAPEVMPRPASMIAQPPPENLLAQNAPPTMQDTLRRQVTRSEPDEHRSPPDWSVSRIPAPRRLRPTRNPSELPSQTEEVNEAVDVAPRLAQDRRHAIQPAPPSSEATGAATPRSPAPPLIEQVATHARQPVVMPSTQAVAPQAGQVLEPLRGSPPKTSLQPAVTVTRLAPPVEPTQPTPPTIHVTIGRIEVRTTPASPAPRQRPAPAVMSLDDYLKRREGERP
jgi:hypothetical protein